MNRTTAPRRRPRRRLAVAVAAVATATALAVGSVGISPAGDRVAHAQAGGIGAGGEFHPLEPKRLYDSRPTSPVNEPSPGKKAIDPAKPFKVHVVGKGGLPADPSQILAVVVNVTVTEPGVAGWLDVRRVPTTSTAERDLAALVNFGRGATVPNLGVVGVAPDGTIAVRMGPKQSASAHVVIDVFGYVSTSSNAARGTRLVTTGPARLIDTRVAGQGPALRAGETRNVKIRGAVSYSPTLNPAVPNRGTVEAALVSITAVNNRARSTSTFLSASPETLAKPVSTANTNVVAGQVKASLAMVKIGADGNIRLYNHGGETDVVVDVFGYFERRIDDSNAGRIVPLDAPFRTLDTRWAAMANVPLGSTSAEDWSFKTFAESLTAAGGGGLGGQSALLANVTATDLRRVLPTRAVSTYLTGYPVGNRPLVSNVNIGEGEVVGNMSLLRYGTAGSDAYRLRMYNHEGSVHYIVDAYAAVLN